MGLTGSIQYETADAVALITLNRPDLLNALDSQAKSELAGAWSRAENDGDVRAIVLSGNGTSFCAGSDLKEIKRDGPADTDTVLAALPGVTSALTKPVIAALHGYTLGMGLNLALHCDIRFAHPQTTIGFPEIRHGMLTVAGAVAAGFLARLDRAVELLLTGDHLSAQDALDVGLVTHVSDDPRADAMALAGDFAQHDPKAVAAMLHLAKLGGRPPTSSLVTQMKAARDSLSQ